MNWLNSLFNKFYFYASLLLLCKPLGVAGFCSSVTQSKFLICESSDSLFFFCFLTLNACRPSSGWPVLFFGVVWINGCFNRPFNSYTHQLAQLDGVSSRGWTSCRWCSWARFSGGVVVPMELDADAGAEQWYKTIAKLMQGRNLQSTHTSELRSCFHASGRGITSSSSYLVDPASSHMLVLKIKPCMSKCSVLLHTRLRTAHYNSYSLFDGFFSVDNRGNSRANTCKNPCRLRVGSIY